MLGGLLQKLDFAVNTRWLVVRLSGAAWVWKQDLCFWGLSALHTVQFEYSASFAVAQRGRWWSRITIHYTCHSYRSHREFFVDVMNDRFCLSLNRTRKLRR